MQFKRAIMLPKPNTMGISATVLFHVYSSQYPAGIVKVGDMVRIIEVGIVKVLAARLAFGATITTVAI